MSDPMESLLLHLSMLRLLRTRFKAKYVKSIASDTGIHRDGLLKKLAKRLLIASSPQNRFPSSTGGGEVGAIYGAIYEYGAIYDFQTPRTLTTRLRMPNRRPRILA